MKRKVSRVVPLALTAVLVMALSLVTVQPAHANDYSGNCEDYPGNFDGSGNVDFNDSNGCTLSQNVTAAGYIRFNVTSISAAGKAITAGTEIVITASGAVEVGNMQTGGINNLFVTTTSGNIKTGVTVNGAGHVKFVTDSGTLDLGTITSNYGGSGGSVLLKASGNIKVAAIGTAGGSPGRYVDIQSNTGTATSTPFTIGSSTTNGVTGSINVASTSGGGTNPTYISTAISIVNGNTSADGGITITSMSNIVAKNSASRSSFVILDARNGTVNLPAGTMDLDGPTGYMAGQILIFADTLETADGTILSATQGGSVSGSNHGVIISANTINVSGTNGLQINADGHGVTDSVASAYVVIAPKGAATYSTSGAFPSTSWSLNTDNLLTTDASLTVGGSGAPIKLIADGNWSRVTVSGNGITFNNGNVTLQSKGATTHEVLIQYAGETPGDVTFGGSGTATLDVSATASGNGGNIYVFANKLTMDKSSIAFKADGPTSGNGDGGSIYVSTEWGENLGFALAAEATATFSANAASSGTGDAQYSALSSTSPPKAITLWVGNRTLKLGTTTGAGQVSLSAKGGSSGGKGGAVQVTGDAVELKTTGAVNVSALSGNGNGGGFRNYAYITSVQSGLTSPIINAIGKGTGTGGTIESYLDVSGLDINVLFKVDGGDSLLSASENDFGRVTLNEIVCQQRTTAQSSWPKAYWNCANPGDSADTDEDMRDAVVALPSGFKTTLGHADNNVQLYVMDTGANFNSFFQPSTTIGSPVGYNLPTAYASGVAVVFEATSGTDETDYLPGNMMHEVGHLLNAYVSPTPTGTSAWTTKSSATESAMKGSWPGTQSPTCMQVFNSSTLCNSYPNTSPWDILTTNYVGQQSVQVELFTFAFQNCSGHPVGSSGLNNAERSVYMRDVYDYMDQTFWSGGCVWEP